VKFSVCTVSLPELTPPEAAWTLRDLGYDGVEWRVVDQDPPAPGQAGFWSGNLCTWPFSTFVQDAPAMRALSADAGLAVPVVGTYVTCLELEAVERAMQGAAALGAPCVRVRVPGYDGAEPYRALRARTREGYRQVAELAHRYGVRAVVETHNATVLPSASAAAAFMEGLDPECVGVIYDPRCLVIEGFEQFRMALEMLGPYLAHVHLKNVAWEPAGARPDGSTAWRASWAPLKDGVLDVPALFAALHAVGYDGWISFEDFCPAQPPRERLRSNLEYALACLAEPTL
jgi:sugar phosphate isomerase/epimerase